MFEVAPPGGLEPPTFRLTAERASQLRHGGLKLGTGSPKLVACTEAVDVKRGTQEQVYQRHIQMKINTLSLCQMAKLVSELRFADLPDQGKEFS